MKGKKILKAIGKSLISPVGIGLAAADAEFNDPVTDGTVTGYNKRKREDLIKKLPKDMRKKLKSFKQFQEAAALAIPAAGLVGKFALPAAATIVGGVGTYLQSRKKKEKEEDLLGAVRKKQAEIQQDVANQETLRRNKDFQDAETKRGKYVKRKQAPENKFVGEAAAVLAAPAIANKVISTGAALWGMYNTINNQGPGIKDGSGTKKGGVWDSLPKGKRSNLKGIANEVRKKMNKEKLKKTIEDLYGPIPEQFNWREKFKA